MKTIIVEVPDGKYCAKLTGDRHLPLYMENRCPLLHRCMSCPDPSFYCAIVNYDTHCGDDGIGILKHNYEPWICPSLK